MPNIPVDDTLVPSGDGEFPVVEDIHLGGSLRVVATTSERNAIPAERRKQGMVVYVIATTTYYQLASDLTTWTTFSTGGGTTVTATGGAAIDAGALIKASSTTALRYVTLATTDDPALMVGVAVTACAGSGQPFTAQFISGVVTMLSDGTTVIGIGDRVEPSTTVAGRIKKGTEHVVGVNTDVAVAATLDAAVNVNMRLAGGSTLFDFLSMSTEIETISAASTTISPTNRVFILLGNGFTDYIDIITPPPTIGPGGQITIVPIGLDIHLRATQPGTNIGQGADLTSGVPVVLTWMGVLGYWLPALASDTNTGVSQYLERSITLVTPSSNTINIASALVIANPSSGNNIVHTLTNSFGGVQGAQIVIVNNSSDQSDLIITANNNVIKPVLIKYGYSEAFDFKDTFYYPRQASNIKNLAGDAAFGANILVMPSSSNDDRFIAYDGSDPGKILFCSLIACGGAGQGFYALPVDNGDGIMVKSDGSTVITSGDLVEAVTGGKIKKASTSPLFVARTSAPAVVDELVKVQ